MGPKKRPKKIGPQGNQLNNQAGRDASQGRRKVRDQESERLDNLLEQNGGMIPDKKSNPVKSLALRLRRCNGVQKTADQPGSRKILRSDSAGPAPSPVPKLSTRDLRDRKNESLTE